MELIIALFVFAFSSTVTPGPNNIMIMTSGMNYGVRKSVPHFLGICIGFPVMVVLVGLGLGVVFERYPVVHQAIKIAGIIYLLYLSWKIATTKAAASGNAGSKPFTFLQAALFQWVNPKAWMMAASAVAAYTLATEPMLWQVLLVALVFFLVAFPCVAVWLFFGTALKRFLKKPKQQMIFNVSMAALLVLSIIPVVSDLL
ncbi:LysE family translocator [Porticoccus sp. W117]|uniref:LysE family translocator n=1 Tax=Porticoccus sp. W117 TaxID=3054777 RepID=UPI0025924354|nr:LysE family translocator [Porticoccus sp. W117]MDM3870905.1 LysE family translocator [Porticoccus sp. W117]